MLSKTVFSMLSVGLIGLALSSPVAQAETILVFGQAGAGNDFTATNNGNTGAAGGTTLSAVDLSVFITGIAAPIPVPISAYLNLAATSVTDVTSPDAFLHIEQNFMGTFSITSGLGGTGTNYLSGTFSDTVFGDANGSSLVLSATGGGIPVFTSDVIGILGQLRGMALSLTNVSPTNHLSGDPTTIAAFTSNISGNFSAVPEPASVAMVGLGMVGLMMFRRLQGRSKVA